MLRVGPSFHLFGLAIGLISTVLPGPGAGFGLVTDIELVDAPLSSVKKAPTMAVKKVLVHRIQVEKSSVASLVQKPQQPIHFCKLPPEPATDQLP